ncbi:hypothetical protein F0562_032257 [Nyssa sinensis]|uniref:BAR domain-containing protein n=1 Tax=Nyssa sinensis TaxID=561372 RepID=A0A5J5APV1_9ASTE|nr:hypothetical protein F0562_032257 [Nyssa sinensis]
MHFAKLDDSPMFRKQIQCLEESAESLRERSLKFYKGCRKYIEGLGEAYDGDIAFASALETFGGGHNDPISVAFGGTVMTKFTIALREIGTYKEVLRSQVEHMLNDRLLDFVNIDLHDVKEARKRFDKASLIYDQAREKFLSLRKGTKTDVATVLEEELHLARSTFEQARFNLVTALSNVEAKKRFEFLEAVSGTMDAHLRYFKQGYELLHQMEPYINQVYKEAKKGFGSTRLGGDGLSRIGVLGGNPTVQISPVKLDENNYQAWSRACLLSIDATGLYDYVNGTIKEPTSIDPTLKQCRSSNSLVMSWLLNSMQSHISRGFLFLTTTCEIWTAIVQTYSQVGNDA